jgi:hypothetical protein
MRLVIPCGPIVVAMSASMRDAKNAVEVKAKLKRVAN